MTKLRKKIIYKKKTSYICICPYDYYTYLQKCDKIHIYTKFISRDVSSLKNTLEKENNNYLILQINNHTVP